MSVQTFGAKVLARRQKNRRLPSVDVPQVQEEGLARSLESIKEHLRMYEGDSNAPKERFVTMQELEDSGIITASVKNKFAFISQIQGIDIMQPAGTSSGSVRKRTAPAVSTATIAAAATPVVATGSVPAGTVDDAMLRWDSTTSVWEEETQLRATETGVFMIFDSLLADSAAFDHDGTDFNTVFVNTTDWNISGITKIQAGAVDADFDALTATSFEGIAAANLVDGSVGLSELSDWKAYSSSGDRWDVTPFVSSSGVMEVGKFIDFYLTDADVTDNAIRITAAAGALTIGGDQHVAGALTATTFGGITQANLLDKTATESVTGTWTFLNNVIRFDRTQPHVQLFESDAGVDEKLWSFRTNGGEFQIEPRKDDNTSAGGALIKATRTGTSIDVISMNATTVALAAALTATSFGGIPSANLLNKAAPEAISGEWTFTNAENIRLNNTRPRLWFTETDATADEGVWRFTATGDTFRLQAFNDAETLSDEAFQVPRTAQVIDSWNFKVVTKVEFDTSNAQLIVKPAGVTGQDAMFEVQGARNSPGAGLDVSSIMLSTWDNDVASVHNLAHITSETVVASDTNLNEQKLAFYYRDAGSLVEGMNLYDGDFDILSVPLKSGLGIPYYVTATYVGGKITVATTAPSTPAKGDIWFDTS